jgi:hypothetical protein
MANREMCHRKYYTLFIYLTTLQGLRLYGTEWEGKLNLLGYKQI